MLQTRAQNISFVPHVFSIWAFHFLAKTKIESQFRYYSFLLRFILT